MYLAQKDPQLLEWISLLMIISVKIRNCRWTTQNIKHLFFQIQCCAKAVKSVTSFGRYIYFEVGTGKKVSIYILIVDSVSVRSRDNSIGVLPRLRDGIPGSISSVAKISFLSKKSKLTLGPLCSLFYGCWGFFPRNWMQLEFQDDQSLAGDENDWSYTSIPHALMALC